MDFARSHRPFNAHKSRVVNVFASLFGAQSSQFSGVLGSNISSAFAGTILYAFFRRISEQKMPFKTAIDVSQMRMRASLANGFS